jgi:MFS family permease
VIAGIAIALSLVPISLTRFAAPQPVQQVKVRLFRLYRISPVGLVGALAVGLANGAWGGLGPVFAHARGLEAGHVAFVMSAAVMGGALSQLPVGRLSDRMDRRKVMIGACVAAIAMALTVGSLPFLTGVPLIGAILVYGMAIFPLYGLAVAHTNDFLTPEDFVEASSALLMVYGFGAIMGPMLGALAMGVAGPGALFFYTALIHLLLIGFVLLRMRVRAAPPEEEKDRFVVMDGAISPQGTMFDPRGTDFDEPDEPDDAKAA